MSNAPVAPIETSLEEVSDAILLQVRLLKAHDKPSREISLAITKLEEAVLWIIQSAVARAANEHMTVNPVLEKLVDVTIKRRVEQLIDMQAAISKAHSHE